MKHKKVLIVLAILGLSTLACMFVERLVFGPPLQETPVISQPTPLSCTGEECLTGCLENLETALATQPFEPLTNEIYVEYKADFDLVIYQVEGDELVHATKLWVPDDYLVYQEDTAAHQRIWDFFVSMIPADQRSMIKEFIVFTDGPQGDVGAWVDKDPDNPGYWKVGFDILDSDSPLYLAYTLLHETGHLITLNTSQIPYDETIVFTGKQNHPKCPNFISSDGCSRTDSYINRFYQRFWKDLYEEWWELDQEAQNARTYKEYQALLEPFYEAHESEFINIYAATAIEEDLAESWAYFVLNPRTEGEDVATQKVLFYYNFPELVKVREQIIRGLCSYVNPK
jgi:hypothetical protein